MVAAWAATEQLEQVGTGQKAPGTAGTAADMAEAGTLVVGRRHIVAVGTVVDPAQRFRTKSKLVVVLQRQGDSLDCKLGSLRAAASPAQEYPRVHTLPDSPFQAHKAAQHFELKAVVELKVRLRYLVVIRPPD